MSGFVLREIEAILSKLTKPNLSEIRFGLLRVAWIYVGNLGSTFPTADSMSDFCVHSGWECEKYCM
jgi:hypothetical protein